MSTAEGRLAVVPHLQPQDLVTAIIDCLRDFQYLVRRWLATPHSRAISNVVEHQGCGTKTQPSDLIRNTVGSGTVSQIFSASIHVSLTILNGSDVFNSLRVLERAYRSAGMMSRLPLNRSDQDRLLPRRRKIPIKFESYCHQMQSHLWSLSPSQFRLTSVFGLAEL